MSLFLKIFLWFWLAIALLVGAFILVGWTTQNEPFVRQLRNFMTDAFGIQAQTGAQIYQNEGVAGLEEYLNRLKSSDRVIAVGMFAADGQRIAGDELTLAHRPLFERALETDELVIDRTREDTVAARRVLLKNGKLIVMMTNLRRPQPLPAERSTIVLRFVVLVGLGGLVCFGLARYISAPIIKLREATRKLASGDLGARVGSGTARGRDEISQLARDFDLMADRLEQLIVSEKTLTRDISHELRSPLARLGVALELAKAKSDAALTPSLGRIETEAARLNEMISRLLLLSKLETGIVGYDQTPFSLTDALTLIAEDAEFEAKATGKTVRLGDIPNVKLHGNEGLVCSALENVIRNAVRYTKNEHPVEIGMKTENDFVVVTVEDGGGGVPESELEKMFRPFYRVGEARERRAGGVGLGLAIAERAVHAHHGTISAENSPSGLRVTIKLPLNAVRQQTT